MSVAWKRWPAALLCVAALAGAGHFLDLGPLAPGVVFAQTWVPRPPEGQPTQAKIDEARKRYDKGIHLYEVEGDVATALVEVQRAYDIAPNFVILYNIGQIARMARDYVTSQRAFAAYLAYGGAKVPADRRETAETELRTLKGLVATLKIFTDVSVGAVLVDDIEVSKLPAAPVLVNPGTRRVLVQSGSRSAAKSVTIAGGEEQVVEIQLGSGAPQPQPKPPPSDLEGPSYVWVGWAVAGALGAGAIVTGTVALTTKSDLDDQAYVGSEPPEDLESQHARVTALSVTTDVLIGASAVCAGVTLYFTIQEATAPRRPDRRPDREPAPALQSLRVTPTGVSIAGSF